MYFCLLPELSQDHFETLTVLIDAGCDFEELFSRTHLFDLFAKFSYGKKYMEQFNSFFPDKYPYDKSTAQLLRFIADKVGIFPTFYFWYYDDVKIPVQTMQVYLDIGLKISKYAEEDIEIIKDFVKVNSDYGRLYIAVGAADNMIANESSRDKIVSIFNERLSRFSPYESETYWEEQGIRKDRDRVEKVMTLRLENMELIRTPRKDLRQRIQECFNEMSLEVHNPYHIFPQPIVKLIMDYIPTKFQIVAQIWREAYK